MNIYSDIRDIKELPAEAGQIYIYVLENYPQKNIKIGRSINPKERMISLSGSNNGGNIINKVAISPMTYLYSTEEACHNYFNPYRISGTEYFSGITFEEAVNLVDKVFNRQSYIALNTMRKYFYLRFPDKVPGFVKTE